MARAMLAHLKVGANSGGPGTTHDFIKSKIAFFWKGANFRGSNFAILGMRANDKGGGHLPGAGFFLRPRGEGGPCSAQAPRLFGTPPPGAGVPRAGTFRVFPQ